MGIVLSSFEFQSQNVSDSGRLIVYCGIAGNALKAISVNDALSRKLVSVSQNKRALFMVEYLASIIPDQMDKIIIKDFDVMFNPNYSIDVLNVLINVNKRKHISIIWPGTIEGNTLVYAEQGYADYKCFNIENYDVICVD